MFQGLHAGHWFTSSPSPSQRAIEGPLGFPTEDLSASQSRILSEPSDWHGARPGVWRVPSAECPARLWMEWSWAGARRGPEAGAGRCPRMSCPGPLARPLPAGPLAWSAEAKETIYQQGEQTTLEVPGRHATLF